MLVVLAVLLAVNTVTTNSQTKEAEVTADGGQILELPRGDVQVHGRAAQPGDPGQPIVLIHCYACSLHWCDKLEPLLAEHHRVIRIDLLGFGGSEKPESGYEIPNQARLVAEALNQLGVEGALVAGNSMGAMVAASLAEQASQLVDRAVVIDMAPNTTTLAPACRSWPGSATRPCSARRCGGSPPTSRSQLELRRGVRAGLRPRRGFDGPDQVVADLRRDDLHVVRRGAHGGDDFLDEQPLDERFKQGRCR